MKAVFTSNVVIRHNTYYLSTSRRSFDVVQHEVQQHLGHVINEANQSHDEFVHIFGLVPSLVTLTEVFSAKSQSFLAIKFDGICCGKLFPTLTLSAQ